VGTAHVTNKPGRFLRPPEKSAGGPLFDSVLYDNTRESKHREVLSSMCRTFPSTCHAARVLPRGMLHNVIMMQFVVYDCMACYPEFLVEYEREWVAEPEKS
jgi:hypothetical protein